MKRGSGVERKIRLIAAVGIISSILSIIGADISSCWPSFGVTTNTTSGTQKSEYIICGKDTDREGQVIKLGRDKCFYDDVN